MSYPHLWKIAIAAALLSACGTPPGRPQPGAAVPAPNEVTDFRFLYRENCAARHGAEGRGGAAMALPDPVYLAMVDDGSMRKAIANGAHGTSMPAFAASSGGMLTDRQIDIIVSQMRSRWSRPGIIDGANPPSYAASSAGDAAHGQAVYRTYCESCHGPDGAGGPKGSAITNDSYLDSMAALPSPHCGYGRACRP